MSQERRILLALMTGADTSDEIAGLIGSRRSVISVALCRLSDAGFIERAGVANDGACGPALRALADPERRLANSPLCPSAFGSGRAPGKTMTHVHVASSASRPDHRRRSIG